MLQLKIRADLEAIVEVFIILGRITPSIPQSKVVILSDSRSALQKLEVLRGAERQHLAQGIRNWHKILNLWPYSGFRLTVE
ncbi:hypothetical protein ElyMa_006465500 [Elysia marginata]|uniref:RNase H type-1 domain-containing protein n=1 Tax=Elysia marginata TaxID=1093978 RepID=A0AAV4HYD9_9GAST|nr:hypothetical protein ElyMa_006465500 [Elysia marginata]